MDNLQHAGVEDKNFSIKAYTFSFWRADSSRRIGFRWGSFHYFKYLFIEHELTKYKLF